MTGSWSVGRPGGSVAERHGPIGAIRHRTVLLHRVPHPTVVVGTGQRDLPGLAKRAAALDLDVVRRSSGGGAVLLRPAGVLWVDVLVPRTDPLWDDDIGRSSAWLGLAWVEALVSMGVAAETCQTDAAATLTAGSLGRKVCFAGRVAGEVVCADRKVVGISQRRDRNGARFQCAVLLGPDAGDRLVVPLVDLLGVEPRAEALAAIRALVGGATVAGVAVEADQLFDAFLNALP
ncbi:MAG: hypothetical protein P8M16_02435 [Acidimicrobiales bacterium]|nr:hypothetical protein [Acidimicrobiales bacterium]